jgi:hypothetical protein
MLRKRAQLKVSKFAHDRALHYLARASASQLSVAIRNQLTEVVLGRTGACDEDSARRGIEWMRERDRAAGRTSRF